MSIASCLLHVQLRRIRLKPIWRWVHFMRSWKVFTFSLEASGLGKFPPPLMVAGNAEFWPELVETSSLVKSLSCHTKVPAFVTDCSTKLSDDSVERTLPMLYKRDAMDCKAVSSDEEDKLQTSMLFFVFYSEHVIIACMTPLGSVTFSGLRDVLAQAVTCKCVCVCVCVQQPHGAHVTWSIWVSECIGFSLSRQQSISFCPEVIMAHKVRPSASWLVRWWKRASSIRSSDWS